MRMKRYIALLLGLIIFCFGFTPIPIQNKVKVKFQPEDTDQEETESIAPPLSSEIFVDEGDYYLARGEKIFLGRDPLRIAVKFKDTVLKSLQRLSNETELQSEFLQQVLNLNGLDGKIVIEIQLRDKGVTIISSKSQSTSSSKLLSSQIRENAGTDVEYATPVFYSKKTMGELILTNEILIRFTDSYDKANVIKLSDTFTIKVINPFKYSMITRIFSTWTNWFSFFLK